MKKKTFIPDWMLERYALGELPTAEMESLRTALASDNRARTRLALLQEDNAAFLDRYPGIAALPMRAPQLRHRFAGPGVMLSR